jgi:hypothetical protein
MTLDLLDFVAGVVAIAILISSMVMLFKGISAFEDKGK